MKKITFIILNILIFFHSLSLNAQDYSILFNKKISSEEIENIKLGQIYFKSIGYLKNACMKDYFHTNPVFKTMKELNPNHLSEIIQFIPYKGNEDYIDRISDFLGNADNYVGIPYYSERTGSWYELYSSAEITDRLIIKEKEYIFEKFYMKPFGFYTSVISVEKNRQFYFFSMKNTEKLRYYDKFDAVGKEKMQAAISVFRIYDYWIVYGLGGADIIKIPFLEKRTETSFTNRIKSFAFFTLQKLQSSR